MRSRPPSARYARGAGAPLAVPAQTASRNRPRAAPNRRPRTCGAAEPFGSARPNGGPDDSGRPPGRRNFTSSAPLVRQRGSQSPFQTVQTGRAAARKHCQVHGARPGYISAPPAPLPPPPARHRLRAHHCPSATPPRAALLSEVKRRGRGRGRGEKPSGGREGEAGRPGTMAPRGQQLLAAGVALAAFLQLASARPGEAALWGDGLCPSVCGRRAWAAARLRSARAAGCVHVGRWRRGCVWARGRRAERGCGPCRHCGGHLRRVQRGRPLRPRGRRGRGGAVGLGPGLWADSGGGVPQGRVCAGRRRRQGRALRWKDPQLGPQQSRDIRGGGQRRG